MLATARVPPVVNGEIGRPGADLFGDELEKGGRRVLVLFEDPAGVAEVAEDEGEAEAPVRRALAGDQIKIVTTECVVAQDVPLVGRCRQEPCPLLRAKKPSSCSS